MAFTLLVNNVQYGVDVEPDTPLLWVLRESYACLSQDTTNLVPEQAQREGHFHELTRRG